MCYKISYMIRCLLLIVVAVMFLGSLGLWIINPNLEQFVRTVILLYTGVFLVIIHVYTNETLKERGITVKGHRK